jgi:hypothetical protein
MIRIHTGSSRVVVWVVIMWVIMLSIMLLLLILRVVCVVVVVMGRGWGVMRWMLMDVVMLMVIVLVHIMRVVVIVITLWIVIMLGMMLHIIIIAIIVVIINIIIVIIIIIIIIIIMMMMVVVSFKERGITSASTHRMQFMWMRVMHNSRCCQHGIRHVMFIVGVTVLVMVVVWNIPLNIPLHVGMHIIIILHIIHIGITIIIISEVMHRHGVGGNARVRMRGTLHKGRRGHRHMHVGYLARTPRVHHVMHRHGVLRHSTPHHHLMVMMGSQVMRCGHHDGHHAVLLHGQGWGCHVSLGVLRGKRR